MVWHGLDSCHRLLKEAFRESQNFVILQQKMDKDPVFGKILSNLETAIFEVSTAIDSKFDVLINKIDRLETKLRN